MALVDEKQAFDHATHLEAVNSLDKKMHGEELETYAKEHAHIEHDLTPWEAIKAYPMAVFWSLMVSMCVIMEGKSSSQHFLSWSNEV